jgi:hypothetical protein
MHADLPAAPGALPPSPISLRCVVAHNTLRVPLLDARVRRTHSRSPVPGGYVSIKVAALSRSVATALHLAGVRALARVRPHVRGKGPALSRSVATALRLAGVRALARVRPHVRGKVTARRRRVATALLLARELALTHLKRECGPTCRSGAAAAAPGAAADARAPPQTRSTYILAGLTAADVTQGRLFILQICINNGFLSCDSGRFSRRAPRSLFCGPRVAAAAAASSPGSCAAAGILLCHLHLYWLL